MAVHNAEIAKAFEEIADLLELGNENAFRIRAYRNAARTVSSLGSEITTLLKSERDLSELPGIGKDLAGKIKEIVSTGHLTVLDELRHHVPAIAVELLRLPGLGPKRAAMLCRELNIHTLPQLHRALLDGRVHELPGFGSKLENLLLQALKAPKAARRTKLVVAESYVTPLLDYLKRGPGIADLAAAGSYRRRQETVGDIDIVASAAKRQAIIDWFIHYEEVDRVVEAGTTRATVVLRSGLQVDLRVVDPISYGAALHYFTGSKAHNIAIRAIGRKRQLKINEYGVFRGAKRIAGKTEAEVYHAVDLPFIEPELRENRGELEAAAAGALPTLIKFRDICGDLHCHTVATDGKNSLREMALAAKERGYSYVAITEHSQRIAMAHGLDSGRLSRQIDEIDRLNAEKLGIVVLKGIEVDILENGMLDLPDSILNRLDLVVGAIHSKFNLSRDKQTDRIVRALERPSFSILAHPSGRLIDEREPYDIDLPRILKALRKRGGFIELNAHPDRLDLSDVHCRMAKDAGVLVSIATDAHRVDDLAYMRFGIGQARRGWLEKQNVLNTRNLPSLRALLKPTINTSRAA